MKPQKIPKLSRRQIVDALEEVPIETVLLGAPHGKKQLTHKQRRFAEEIAKGNTKAGAYRAAYNSKATPKTQSLEGQRMAASPAIARQIDALRLAAEARKHATPAALRALVIERLTAHAIDEDVQPAQRLKALELLGKITEVAAFTERRELIKTTDAGAARSALVDSLRAALRASAADAEIIEPLLAVQNPIDPGPVIEHGADPAIDEPRDAQADGALPGEEAAPDADPADGDPTHPAPPAREIA